LRATGRVLIPEKCFWYFIKPEWQQTKAKWIYTDPDPSYHLQVPDNEGKLEDIPQLKASKAHRTLGVRLAPDSNEEAELQT